MRTLGSSLATLLTGGLLIGSALAPAPAAAGAPARPGDFAKQRGPRATPSVSNAVHFGRAQRRHKKGTTPPAAPGSGANSGGGNGNGGGSPQTGTKPRPAPTPAPAPTPIPAPAPPPSTGGRITFASGFDGSFSGWYVQSLSSRATLSTAHPFEGSGAARLEVRPGDVEPDTGSQRSEVSGPTFHEGEDVYVRDEIRVPYGYTFEGSWQLINQLHEKPWSGSPGIATFLEPNRAIRFGAGDGSPTYWRGPQLEFERWYTFVYRVVLSRNASLGFVEVWLDGVPQTLVNGSTRMFGETIQTPETYLKAGIYRSSSSTGVSIVEHDNIVVGTSYGAVMSY
jgi:hypothetical protein